MDRDVLQQLESAFQRVGAYAFPPVLWEEEVRRQVLAECTSNAHVCSAAYKLIVDRMKELMERDVGELCGTESAACKEVQGRAKSNQSGSKGLSTLQVNR